MAVAMSAFLSGSVTVSVTFAGRDLDMSTAEVTWMSAATSLSSGSLLLFFGSFADLFGRKSMFIGSMFLFAVFSLGAGFSKNGVTLDIMCGILGIFGASAVPAAQGMLGTIYDQPSQRKNKAFGCFSAGNPLGFVFGIIFSGLATQLFSWRAAFWLLAIVYLVVSILAAVFVPPDYAAKVPWNSETLKRLDLPGTSMTILGIGMFCAALTLGGDAPNGWKTPYVLVLLIIGTLLIVAFIFWEIKYPYAMIDMTIWKDRNFSLLLAVLSLGFIGFPVVTFWLSLWFQRFLGYTSLMTGVHMLPMAVCGVLANVVVALIQHKVSNTLIMAIGAFSYVVSFLLIAVQRSGDSYWAFSFPGLCLIVVGADFQFVVTNMYVMSSMPPNKQSIAGSLLQTLTRLSQAVGMGIATAIYDAVERSPSTSGYYANDPIAPYAGTFWFATGMATLGVILVPFLTIGTQGHHGDEGRSADGSSVDVSSPVSQEEKSSGQVAIRGSTEV
ncbi:MFS general substrate transporter [Bimuria novae-zelandiae CBS 107.79]|uniref:MFS general substrate transporter n=1 Tax=Bimuria novae-zelandiae CBS 107.79 TaxID=1447943 RepID=A0A6A5VR01_9PLEO|nr:MFS general substrate transporter [Bimuria novae-zelandiae CBS 107.79]